MEHMIKDLLNAMGCDLSPDIILEHTQNNPNFGTTTYGSKETFEHAVKLSQHTTNPRVFIHKIDELKLRHGELLAPVLHLLYSVICEGKKAKSAVSKPKTLPKPVMGDNKYHISKDEVPQIRDKILKNVDETRKLVKKSFEEKDTNHRPSWHKSLNFPHWLTERTGLSWDFPKELTSTNLSIASIPVPSQEIILLDELLYCLSGLPGNYIVPQPLTETFGHRTFKISDDVDQALQQIINQILPLASNYSIIRRFTENAQFWSGQVIHALVFAIEIFLKDYHMMLAQLETEYLVGSLNIQKLWYFVRPTMHTMEVLANISTSIGKSECRGGAVLSLLHEKTSNLLGDTRAQEVCLFLTEKASQPYMQILHQWIHRGAVDDPFQEFLIEDNELIKKEDLPLDYSADYWEKRYTIQRDRVPKFLDKLADVILRTGKYLNVISQCGKILTLSDADEIKYTLREQHYVSAIQRAYSFASKSLLELLLKEYDLMGRLKSVKHYFLMDQGDFIVQFMDSAEPELMKNIDDIVPSKLESLLGLCLRLSAASHDPYHEDMRTELLPYDLQFQMFKILSIQTEDEKNYRQQKERLQFTGVESFSFAVDVKWPVSLILNRKAIACYQMIFRHLFFCKHVERLLCRVWICNKVAKRFAEGRQYAAAFALRQRMLGSLQNLQYYMCIEVIEPRWSAFIASLDKVNNVDEVLDRHSDFLEACLGDCMLTSSQLLQAVTTMCNVCVQFCQFIQEMRKYFVDAEMTGMIGSAYEASESMEGPSILMGKDNNSTGDSTSSMETDTFDRSISKYDLRFTAALLSLMAMIRRMARDNNTNKLVNLMHRLDFNTFYAEQLENLRMDNTLPVPSDKTSSAST